VVDEQEGLLFCPADWNELAEKMAHLLTDRTLRERIGQAARSKVEAQFEVGHTIGPLAALFKTPRPAPALSQVQGAARRY
jgi:glycosyltransferase involved in cell wall biosynthesis